MTLEERVIYLEELIKMDTELRAINKKGSTFNTILNSRVAERIQLIKGETNE